MSRFKYSFATLALSLALVASTANTLRAQDAAAVANSVQAARNSFLAAYSARNAEQLANVFAKDAYFAGVVLPRWYDGRAQIQQGWAAFFARFGTAEITFYPHGSLRISGDGTMAMETGCLLMRMVATPGKEIVNQARYSATRQLIGGQWLITNLHVSEPTGQKLTKIEDKASCIG